MNVTRVSRPLVGILGVTLLVGAITYAATHRNKGTPAQAMGDTPGGKSAPGSLIAPPPSGKTTGAAVPPAAHPLGGSGSTPRAETGDGTTKPPLLAMGQMVAMPRQSVPAISGTGALAEGKAKLDAGELLAGRKLVNDALNSGSLSPGDVASAKALISEANNTILFSPRHFTDDPYGGTFLVPPGGVMARIAKTYSVTADLLCRINGLSDPRRLRASQTIKVVQGPFHAVISKSAFRMDLYLGGAPGDKGAMYMTSYPVGLGKDDSTPTGTWICEPGRKLTNPKYYSPRGEGVVDAGDPKNPLGKFWIGLAGTDGQAIGKTSYGIHGTIEPDSIGKQASMGCIRMRNEDIAIVYEMLVEGKSAVIVKD